MPLVIDAFNVLHVTGVLPPELAGLDLDALAGLVESSRYGTEEVWLVCDGTRPPNPPQRRARLWFSWAGPGATADDLIVGLVRRSSAPRRMTVVTNDRAIVKEIRRRGAEHLSSEALLKRLAADWEAASRTRRATVRQQAPSPRATLPLAAPEVRAWLAIFGLEGGLEGAAADIAASDAPKAERPRPVAAPTSKVRPPPSSPPSSDDPLAFAGLDLARLLGGTPPRRDEPRAPRRTRRDRRS